MLQYFEGNDLLLPAVIIGFIISLVLIWLMTRSIRLWYWKVNTQVDTIKSIDEKLQELSEEIKINLTGFDIPEPTEESEAVPVEIEAQPESRPEETHKKVYTEEELEILIRD